MNFVFSFSIIITALASGFFFNRAVNAGRIPLSPQKSDRFRLILQKTALIGLNPIAFGSAIWALDLKTPSFFALPVIGILVLAFGCLLGFAGNALFKLPPEKAGVYVTCSSFTNIGNIGGLVVFVLAGEAAFAFVPLYKLFEELVYYAFLFPLARRYGEKARETTTPQGSLDVLSGIRKVLMDPFFLVSISGITIGLCLNVTDVYRPAFFSTVTSVLVPLTSFMLLFAIGMRLRFGHLRKDWKEASLIVFQKAFLVPVFAFGLAIAFGLGVGGSDTALKTVLILSCMPIGFLGLVPPALYGLDIDFANNLWLASNGFLVVIVPVLSMVIAFI